MNIDAQRTREIDASCMRLSFARLRPIALSSVVLAPLMALIVRSRVPSVRLQLWLGATALFVVVRLILAWAYHRRPRTDAELVSWFRLLALALCTSATIWGFTAFLSGRADDTFTCMMSVLFIAGIMASGTVALIGTPRLLLVTAVCSTTPLMVFLLGSGVSELRYLALVTLLYLVTMAKYGRDNHLMLRESMALRFQNADLAARLAEQKAEAEAARDRAEAATDAKNRFLAAASHDIRQPIHAALLLVGAVEHRADASAHAELLGKLRRALTASRQMLDALLDVSKLEAGVVERVDEPFSAADLAIELANLLGPLAARKRLRLAFRAPADLFVDSDRDLCVRILVNLASNAIRYSDRGGVLVAFRPRANGEVLVQVWDTGRGIAEGDVEHIFDEFRQLGEGAGGIGLGLAIVEKLCVLLGTKIVVRSKLGRGSVFSFTLRRGERVEPAARTESVEERIVPRSRVLVLDDDDVVREALCALLDAWGHDAASAREIDEAVGFVRAQAKFDLFLVDDLLANGKRAHHAIEAVLAVHGAMPAIVITGNTHPRVLQEEHDRAWPVLRKPLRPDELRAAIARALAPPA